MDLLPGLRQVRPDLGGCNVFLWEGDGDSVLIDAGLDPEAHAVLEALRDRGLDPPAVTHILLTHAHQDHVGGLHRLVEATHAQVAMYDDEDSAPDSAGRADPGQARPVRDGGRIFQTQSVPVAVHLLVRDQMELPGGLVAIHTPGHTPGHTCYYHPDRRFLLVGDALFHFPPLSGPAAALSWDLAEARASIRRMAELEFDVLGFGHGLPVTQEASARLIRLMEIGEADG